MKKFLLSILTIMYMTVSTGIAMEIHYCMGKKAGIDFYNTKEEKCVLCGMKEKKGGCCSDEHKFFKLDDSHKIVSNDLSFNVGETALTEDHPIYDWQQHYNSVIAPTCNYSPPDYRKPSLGILNCIFRI